MRLARTVRFDDSDTRVFALAAQSDEWAVSGAFAFSNWCEAGLVGQNRQAFANGWLGLQSFGRATFVAVAEITEAEYQDQIARLAAHFVDHYGAPDLAAAQPSATEEVDYMRALAEDHPPNTLLIVERHLVEAGVSEAFRALPPQDADLEAVAVHGSVDPI